MANKKDDFEDLGFEESFEDLGFQEDMPMPSSTPSVLEAGAKGLEQGGTLGFSDEIRAALATAATRGSNLPIEDLYTQYRDIERKKLEEAKQAHPTAFMAGELGGGLATSFVPGLGATSLGKAAALGGTAALGMSEADLTKGEIGEAAKDTAIGTGLGVGGFKVGGALANVISRRLAPKIGEAAKALKTEAEDTALSVIGARAKDIEKELGAGKGILVSPEYRKGLGKEALGKIKFTGGPEGVRKEVNDELLAAINQKKPLLEEAANQLKSKKELGELTNLEQTSIKNQLQNILDKKVKEMSLTEINPKTAQNIQEMFSDYIERVSQKDLDINALEEAKKTIGKALSDRPFQSESRDLAVQDDLLKSAYMIVKNRIEELADAAGPNLGQQIKAINQKEGNLIDLNRIAFAKEAKETARGAPTFGDYFAFGLGSALSGGNILGGIAAAGVKAGLERATGRSVGELGKIGFVKSAEKGSQIGSKSAEILSKTTPEKPTSALIPVAIEKGKELTDKAKEVVSGQKEIKQKTQSLYQSTDDELRNTASTLRSSGHANLADALEKSIEDGNQQSKNAIIFSILQNPNTRKLVEVK